MKLNSTGPRYLTFPQKLTSLTEDALFQHTAKGKKLTFDAEVWRQGWCNYMFIKYTLSPSKR